MVKRIEPADIPIIEAWHKAHGAPFNPKVVPEVGFIAEGVAAGFLWIMEHKIAMLDSFVTSPIMGGQVRHAALNAIIDEMKHYCSEAGIKRVICITNNREVGIRCSQNGVKPLGGYTLFAKEL